MGKKRGKKRKRKGKKGRKKDKKKENNKRGEGWKGSKKLVKKFRLRHTLEIYYGEENSTRNFFGGKEIKLK